MRVNKKDIGRWAVVKFTDTGKHKCLIVDKLDSHNVTVFIPKDGVYNVEPSQVSDVGDFL